MGGKLEAGLRDGGLITPCSACNKSRSESKSQPYPKGSSGGAGRDRWELPAAPSWTSSPSEAPMAAASRETGASPSRGWWRAEAISGRQLCGQGAENAPLFSCHLRATPSRKGIFPECHYGSPPRAKSLFFFFFF